MTISFIRITFSDTETLRLTGRIKKRIPNSVVGSTHNLQTKKGTFITFTVTEVSGNHVFLKLKKEIIMVVTGVARLHSQTVKKLKSGKIIKRFLKDIPVHTEGQIYGFHTVKNGIIYLKIIGNKKKLFQLAII